MDVFYKLDELCGRRWTATHPWGCAMGVPWKVRIAINQAPLWTPECACETLHRCRATRVQTHTSLSRADVAERQRSAALVFPGEPWPGLEVELQAMFGARRRQLHGPRQCASVRRGARTAASRDSVAHLAAVRERITV